MSRAEPVRRERGRSGPRAWLAVTALVAAALLTSAPVGGQTVATQLARDPEARFTINVPATWIVKTSRGDLAVEATAPNQGPEPPDSVDVVAHDLPMAISAKTCVDKAAWVMRVLGHIPYTTVREGPMPIGTLAGYAHAYTWKTRAGDDRWSLQVCVVAGLYAYVITGTTTNTPARVEEAAPLLTRSVATFKLTGTPRGPSPRPAYQPGGGE